ncbi:protease stability complex PrcB-like protein [Ureibacillus xyleni]|uniref:Protease stability complex PrcB-like protein n=1 Tax=Ureibacillus xyleni TaxID=614648 RepID=A0A285SSE1_9BACL|nr:protease complex subunit PrcB family protein [Ureibacillus xyleni]SOC11289.1 protease stability complex PrcB-like protein [Ureibacillus xyleni]
MGKSKFILASLFAVSVITPIGTANANEVRPVEGVTSVQNSFLHFTEVDLKSLTDEEKSFVEEAKKRKPGLYSQGNLYVITLGEKPTTGYSLKFVESKTNFEKEQIFVKMTSPASGTFVGDAITYPYIVGKLELPSKYMSIEVIDVDTGKSAFLDKQDIFESVHIHKDWTIRFNTQINENTVTPENIYIYEKANGKEKSKFPAKLSLLSDGKTVKVTPLTSYKYSNNYTIFISKEVSSTKNVKMKNDKEVSFSTMKEPEVVPVDPSKQITFSYKFIGGAEGWEGAFSDYEEDMDIKATFEHKFLPSEVGKSLEGLYLSSSNRSDDVFMYIKKKLSTEDGIKPNTTYQVNLAFDLVTNIGPDLDIGAGGSPGGSVFVKAGATAVEPKPILEKNYYRTNIDHGDQSEGGTDAEVIGNITKTSEGDLYEIKPFEHKVEVTTDENGELWLVIGTDSGFEGITSLYYTNIHATITEK